MLQLSERSVRYTFLTMKSAVLSLLLLPLICNSQTVSSPKAFVLLSRPQIVAVCAAILNVAADAESNKSGAQDVDLPMTVFLLLREVWIDSEPLVLPLSDLTDLNNRALMQSKEDFIEQFAYCGSSGRQLLAQQTESKRFALLSRAVAYREAIMLKRKR